MIFSLLLFSEGHRYAECVGVFETVPTVETADCLCYLALALYKSGQLQESARGGCRSGYPCQSFNTGVLMQVF